MKFSEIPGKAIEAMGRFTQEQLDARQARLNTPEMQALVERQIEYAKEEIKDICTHAFFASLQLTIGAPAMAIWKGVSETGGYMLNTSGALIHNFFEKEERHKKEIKEYPFVSGLVALELLKVYGKGAVHLKDFIVSLSKLTGRSGLLGVRYLIGK